MTSNQQLFFAPDEVPVGVSMHLCAPGTDIPATDENGILPPLVLLYGGVPPRPKWYVLDPEKEGMPSGGFKYEAIRDGVRFTPAVSFSADDAPIRKQFIVFVGGERLKYDDYPSEFVEIAKATDGRIVSYNGCAHNHWLHELELPGEAILLPAGDFRVKWDFELLGCIGVPKPNAKQREALEALGVTFFDHAPFGEPAFVGYSAVRLPRGWQVRGGESRLRGVPFEERILDAKGQTVALVKQRSSGDRLSPRWTGKLTLAR